MEITRLFDIIEWQELKFQKSRAIFAKKKENKWIEQDIEQYHHEIKILALGLIEKGFKKGDKIATVSSNRYEWNVLDMAMMMLGVIHIPIYPTISDEEYEYILAHSEAKYLIISDMDLYYRLLPYKQKIKSLEHIFTITQYSGIENWKDLFTHSPQLDTQNKLKEIQNSINENDTASIIYTSGTTGTPKGVMLSHKNIVSNAIEMDKIIKLHGKNRALSVLPLCHVLERVANYVYQIKGIQIYYSKNIHQLKNDLKEIKPHVFIAVPRIIEKIYDNFQIEGEKLYGIKYRIFKNALDTALKHKETRNSISHKLKLNLYRKLIFNKWQKALGGRLKFIVSGGAALQDRLARIYWAAGIPVLEGYGLTETSPVISVNRLNRKDLKFGTVGVVLKNQKVKISEDGEILMQGPNLMQSYFKDADLFSKVIDQEGWFHTGDIGELIENKFLKITDRKKEIFKLSTGKYVTPQQIENKFKESRMIDQLMVLGENKKYVAALICPDFKYLEIWAKKKQINYKNFKELISNQSVITYYQSEVNKYNKTLGKTQRIKRFELVCESWSSQTNELTPTLKLRREKILSKYATKIEAIYKH